MSGTSFIVKSIFFVNFLRKLPIYTPNTITILTVMASTTIFYNDRFSRIPSNNILLALSPGIIVGNISGKVLMDAPHDPGFC